MPLNTSQIEVMDDAMVEVLRLKTPAERLLIANRMSKGARRMIGLLLRAENPTWPDQRIEQETARRLSHGAAVVNAPREFFTRRFPTGS